MANSKQVLWAAGRDETVEVNQRALIDKVLARYSAKFTVFRELLQNSDDAEASSVEIRFQTGAYLSRENGNALQSDKPEREDLPDLKAALVHQWTFKNNGILFRDQDWNRLKKIADGNPDEEKIGAFGVGFYSLFSVTDEPWVMSGGQWMNFYWKDKKDQLYVRRGTIPASVDDVVDPWTTFQMTLREPGSIPAAFDLTQFLVSSIIFMTHLSEVSIYLDDRRLVRLSKDCGVPKELPMLNGLTGTSPEGMMNVKSIEAMPLQINAEMVRWLYTAGSEKLLATSRADASKPVANQSSGVFSSLFATFGASSTPSVAPNEPINLFEATSSNIVLTIFAANVEVRLDDKMTGELLRSTLKKPPGRLRYEMIYTGKEEYDASVKAEEEAANATESVFQGLRADLEGTGSSRVFIGHSTGQTTGIGGHMAARFIPTVERESIDLVDRNVAVWNKELLYVGGFLARSVYEFELDAIKELWNRAAALNCPGGLPDEEVQTRLRGRALHALKFFTFHPSTPSPMVSNLMEAAFFACATTHPFSIISSDGVRNLSEVHIADPKVSGFLKRLPLIPEDIVNGAKAMILALRSREMINDITFVEVLNELRLGPLSEAETVHCLAWWVGVTRQEDTAKHLWERAQLWDALVISVSGSPTKTIKLSDAQTFSNSQTRAIFPTDGPLPSTAVPTSITSSFASAVLESSFLWKQLSVVEWLRHMTDPEVAAANAEFDVTVSASWAERVLYVLAYAWPSLSAIDQWEVIKVLDTKSCVPTSTGLKVPNQAYFPSVNSFQDLPIVTLPSDAIVADKLKNILQSLGVRECVELEIILDRMVATGEWTAFDLVKYLVSVRSTLTAPKTGRLSRIVLKMRRLSRAVLKTGFLSQTVPEMSETPAFPKEGAGKEQLIAGTSPKVRLYRAKYLYEPIDILRELGLPIIDWGANNQWRPESKEAKFLFLLGLKRVPPLTEILRIAASENLSIRTKAFSFFLDNISNHYSDYDPENFRHLAFVPGILGSEKVLAKPYGLYTGAEWAALGFTIVDPTLQGGAAGKLKLKKHPPTSELVTLLKRSPPGDEAAARQWFQALSGLVSDFSPAQLRELLNTPFVPVESTGDKGVVKRLQPNYCFLGATNSDLYSKLFTFVDFGSHANVFLGACGARQEPSIEDFAQLLLTEPRRIFNLANGRENYLYELRNLAVNRRRLGSGITNPMRASNVLLGSRRVKKDGSKAWSEGNQEDWDFQDELLRPSEVAIVDDANAYRLFGHRIFCAPQEGILEDLYLSLGSPRLSSLVKEYFRTSSEAPYSKIGAEVRHLILERLPLFLHEHPQSGIEVSLNWLSQGNNFVVRVFGKLLVTKSLHHGDIRDSRSHEASAVAKREGNGPIELWLAGNKQLNVYEISTSLCRIIFQLPKTNDSLLFMTILSTDLTGLRQCGYDIDRILQQQKARRQATERAKLERTETVEREETEKTKIPITQTNIPLPPVDMVIAILSPLATQSNSGVEQTPKYSRVTSAIHELLPRNGSDVGSSRSTPPTLGEFMLAGLGLSRELVPSPQPDSTVTSPSSIANNIDMAIKACTSERSDLLRNRKEMEIVSESLDGGCCHFTRQTRDLEPVGSMGDIMIFAMPDLPEPESLIQRKHDVLARFLYVLKPLVGLYKIPQTSLQIFADKEGQLISLNRGGRLVMNLRYFEALHDRDVQRGDFSDALIYWYFTLAHGIAHNLIYLHDSEHEFYFSAICEAYLKPLINLLSDPRQIIRL